MNRALFIGRFQPLHNGHMEVIKAIYQEFDGVVVAIGSAYESYTHENPFTAGERYEMIEAAMRAEGLDNYSIVPVPDINRYDVWPYHVLSLCPRVTTVYTNNPLIRKLFASAGMEVRGTEMVERSEYSGREIRSRILRNESWHDLVPESVIKVMEEINGVERIRLSTADDYDQKV